MRSEASRIIVTLKLRESSLSKAFRFFGVGIGTGTLEAIGLTDVLAARRRFMAGVAKPRPSKLLGAAREAISKVHCFVVLS